MIQSEIKLSIVIPTYNRCNSLKMTIDSILSQLDKSNNKFIEIIVTDNCSTDSTKELLQSYDSSLLIINYNKTNLGYVKNFYIGIEKAIGEYVWLVGSDDVLVPGSINKILSVLVKQKNVDLVFLNHICLIPSYSKDKKNKNNSNFERISYLDESVPEGCYEVRDFSKFNLDIFTAIYSFLLKREDWLSALNLFNHSMGTFDLATNTYPHAFYIATRLYSRNLYYINRPILLASYEISWIKYLPICLIQYLPELYDVWQSVGVPKKIIREKKERLIFEHNHIGLIKKIQKNIELKKLFSMTNYVKRFYNINGFISVVFVYLNSFINLFRGLRF